MKAAIVTRDKFVKYIHTDDEKPARWFTIIRPYSIDFYNYGANESLDRRIDKIEFRLDRIYENEFGEKVAVYHEV